MSKDLPAVLEQFGDSMCIVQHNEAPCHKVKSDIQVWESESN